MCWSNYIATPILLKKPLKVYKVGTVSIFGGFISLFQGYVYHKCQVMPTVEITPEFIRTYYSRINWIKFIGKDSFDIHRGYHSYLTEEAAWHNQDDNEIGIFEIPAGATIYVNYKRREVVSTDIKYLGLLEE